MSLSRSHYTLIESVVFNKKKIIFYHVVSSFQFQLDKILKIKKSPFWSLEILMGETILLPSEHNGDNASLPVGDFYKGGFGHVEVSTRWVAPAAVVAVLRPVGRAEVGCGHGGDRRAFVAVRRFSAPYLEALPASISVVE